MHNKRFRRRRMLIVILVFMVMCLLLLLMLLFTTLSDRESLPENLEDNVSDIIVQDDLTEENLIEESASKDDTSSGKDVVSEKGFENISNNISFEDEEDLEEIPVTDDNQSATKPSKPPVTEPVEPPSETEDSAMPPKAPSQDGEWGTPIQN